MKIVFITFCIFIGWLSCQLGNYIVTYEPTPSIAEEMLSEIRLIRIAEEKE